MRKLRGVLITTVFTGAVMSAAGVSASATGFWIYHYDGAFDSVSRCQEARQEFIEQNQSVGQPISVWPCAYHDVNPETGTGPAGWYYRWGILAD
ncbi:hypothetical protein DFJ66_8205 [Saccharothrix variisporea]|uniref:Uncharacterized protein n=2 Tax=Saccharothrix variisporea TaxID=543527 RepID=A0A495XJX5_9PSEU|nr:hypothetical protein DFJ66_8205 [Saccharothrix variisporea]